MKFKKNTFVDKYGKEWTGENLQDLIDGYRAYIKFKAMVEYYDERLLKD